ncbi:MAG: hypothetical protein HYT08_03700 [Candidatus Levybacteria bacterium]|nr:hypothetical protein [Candidatus Levybacteria bacterium]
MDSTTKGLTKSLDEAYAKLPALPVGIKEFIVTVAPWLALIFGILAILAGISAFGLLSVLSPFAAVSGAGQYAISGIISSVILLAQGVVELIAFPSLQARKIKGWNLIFLSLVLSVLSSLTTLSISGVLWSLIAAAIGYYFLYQVKSYYK